MLYEQQEQQLKQQAEFTESLISKKKECTDERNIWKNNLDQLMKQPFFKP